MKEDVDEHIVLALTGRASADDLAHLDRWRRASIENERYYQEFVALWRLTDAHPSADLRGEVPRATDLLRAPRRPFPRPTTEPEPGRLRRVVSRYRRSITAAAALVVAVGLGYLVTAQPVVQDATAEFRSSPNELSTVVLDDGTIVRLAPSSRLSVSFEADKREVAMEGRAFFAVSPDPDRPFDVRTDDGVVRVVGTRFDLFSRPGGAGTRLLVLDGKVTLSTAGSRSDLEAGHLAVTSPTAEPSIRRVQDPERMLGWLGTWVAFEGTPLHRVARELEIRLDIPIEIADPGVGERTVVGWFAQEERDEMIDMVCRAADVDCSWVDGRVVISAIDR